MTMRLLVTLLVGSLGLGCGGKSSPPASGSTVSTTSAETEEEAEPETAATAVAAGLDMLESAGAAIAGGADCAEKGALLREWSAANQALISDVAARLKSVPENQVEAEVEVEMPKRERVSTLFGTAQECSGDETFRDAWDETSAAFEQ